jgi:thiopurine S-methyltransferase
VNKGKQFWLELWQQGRTAFHKDFVNPDLERYWSSFNLSPPATVLLPLCGKSQDILWLAEQGFQVIGIELSELALLQFAEENNLSMSKKTHGEAINYSTPEISIWIADIFSLNIDSIPPVDAIYDRAALIALPKKLRPDYVRRCLQWLKPDGKIFLKTMSYDEVQLCGPPYSVTASEVKVLYKERETLICLSERRTEVDAVDPLYERGLQLRSDYIWQIQ